MASMMKLLVVVLGLLLMVSNTMQLSPDHPLHTVVERLNVNTGPFLGLVISSGIYERMLTNSTYFVPDTSIPYITIAGRRFNFGKFNDVPVIYVLAGKPLANVGVTVQILLDTFRIKGIINYGAAGTVSNQVIISDVVVPSQVAFTGVWRWQKFGAEFEGQALKIGDYNVPEAGDNKLSSIEFQKTQKYTPTSSKKSTYWFNVHSDWISLASQLNFGERFTVHVGGGAKMGSSDIYMANKAYGAFLNKELGVSAVDSASAAVVSTAIANGVPHIVIKGTSNRPGTDSDPRFSETTAKNVLKTVAVFIDNLSPKTTYAKDFSY